MGHGLDQLLPLRIRTDELAYKLRLARRLPHQIGHNLKVLKFLFGDRCLLPPRIDHQHPKSHFFMRPGIDISQGNYRLDLHLLLEGVLVSVGLRGVCQVQRLPLAKRLPQDAFRRDLLSGGKIFFILPHPISDQQLTIFQDGIPGPLAQPLMNVSE